MMSFLISARVQSNLTGPNKKARMAALLLPQQQSAEKRLHKSNSVCVCACVCMLCMCVHGCVCVSVHQTGEEKNNPITETVCLNDIQYVHGKKERCVCV